MNKTLIVIFAFGVALIAAMLLGTVCITPIEVNANNRSLGWGCYDFRHIHIYDGVEGHCATIEQWYDNDGAGIEIKTTEWGNIFCSEGSYILFETSACPFCGGK